MSEQTVRLGWWLSSEEHGPRRLVEQAVLAEAAGLTTAMISDHLQPWVPAQGHAGHVWTTLGAIAQATEGLEVGTGVTAMVHRNHPLAVAHAAATAAVLLEDRFFLGVGSGERLNEQPYGRRWPRPGERRRRLVSAIDVIRRIWTGEEINVDDGHWRVEGFRLLERPASPPPIHVAVSGPRSATVAGQHGDGLIAVSPNARAVDGYHAAGGAGPVIGQLHISLAATRDEARAVAWRWWPNGAVAAPLLAELARPSHFEVAAEGLRPETIDATVLCTTDAADIVAAIDRYVGAGFDTLYLHQVGPDQERLLALVRDELLPHYRAP